MPQSLHVLSVHIIFSTKERRPWLSQEIRPRLWAYQSPPLKVLELLKKDSSKFVKSLRSDLAAFHWQDGYGLFSVSPSHLDVLPEYILHQEAHHKKETFQEEFLRILKKYQAPYDERYLWD